MRYIILDNPEAPEAEADTVEGNLAATVSELSGRGLGGWFATALHRKGSVYVATAPDSPGRAKYGRGFIVRKVSTCAEPHC